VKSRQELEARIEFLERRNAELELRNAELERRLVELEALVAKLSRNSSNSSKPPSSDPPGNPAHKAKAKNKKKRKRGGQPGHKAHRRDFLKPDHVKDIVPKNCWGCGGGLRGRDDAPRRVQIVEVPAIKPVVTDFMCHTLSCEICKRKNVAAVPFEARGGVFGPRLSALVALFAGRYKLSKRLTQEFLSDVLGVNLALGSVSNIERRLSSVLAQPVEDAKDFVRQQEVVHADETGWTENKKKAWLWIVACPLVAVFVIASSRGKAVAQGLLGKAFAGIAVTDRWVGYAWLPNGQRQICWSHLLRDFQSWVDDGGAGVEIGNSLLSRAQTMFRWWRKVGEGGISRTQFQYKMCDLQNEVGRLLLKASVCGHRRVEGMARKIIEVEDALWTFVDHNGVEPTNNFGERIIRSAVMWRKQCFGTDSSGGSRFAERIMTAVSTLRLQRRPVLEYLTDAYRNSLRGLDAPALVPEKKTQLQQAA
jgi:transposase